MGETPYFWVFKVTENEMFTNIPFAKLEMSKKLIFVKIRFRPSFFFAGNMVIPREKNLDLIVFFSENPVFSRKTRKLLVANCKGNQFPNFGGKYEFAPEKRCEYLCFASFIAVWPYLLRKTVRPERTLLHFIPTNFTFWPHPLRRKAHTCTCFSGA